MQNKLLTNFYTESSSNFDPSNESTFTVKIHLNSEHPIYKGHFEQIPITPGVCQAQIIKELLMEKFQVELQLSESDSLKFLAMINPQINPDLNIAMNVKKNENVLDVSAVISDEQTVFTKFKGKFVFV